MLVLGMSESLHSRTHINCPQTVQDLSCQHSVMGGEEASGGLLAANGCWEKGSRCLGRRRYCGVSVLTQAALVKLSGSQNKIKLEEKRTGGRVGGLGGGG